jgi:hypothetical protein
MSLSLRLATAAIVLAVTYFLAPVQAQTHCPDVRATTVAPSTTAVGLIDDCSVDTTIFGWHFITHGPRCPTEQDVYPSHGECLGAASPGTLCGLGQVLAITRQKCECTYGFLWSHFYHPRCECEDSGTAGTIDDFHTQPCYVVG